MQVKRLDEANGIKRRLSGAPIKDTVTVPDGGYTVIRFLANNPGFWLFHCHIEFHVEVGMALVFKVGDYNQMPNVPENFPTCSNFMPNTDHEHKESRTPAEAGTTYSHSNTNKIALNSFVLIPVTLIAIVCFSETALL